MINEVDADNNGTIDFPGMPCDQRSCAESMPPILMRSRIFDYDGTKDEGHRL